MSSMPGTQVLAPRSKTKGRPVRFQCWHSFRVFDTYQKRLLVTDDADRNFLIPLELKTAFVTWVEHEFTGNEDRFDAYRVADC